MKTTLIALGVLVALVAAFFGLNAYIYTEEQGDGGLVADYKTATYYISGAEVHLGEGGVTYFGNEVEGDLDGDGDLDKAFLIVDQPGGSGSFFYLVGAINEGGKYKGTNAMLIGDRIAPQTTEFNMLEAPYGARVVVNYADRAPGEPFTTQPSIGTSLYAKYSATTNDFGVVVQNFEGESR
jgi:hypothetical protein